MLLRRRQGVRGFGKSFRFGFLDHFRFGDLIIEYFDTRPFLRGAFSGSLAKKGFQIVIHGHLFFSSWQWRNRVERERRQTIPVSADWS